MLRPIDYILQPREGWFWLRNFPQNAWWWFTSERMTGGYSEPPEYYCSRARVLRIFFRNLVDPRYLIFCVQERVWPWDGLLDALRWPE
ncbi:MAG: hypothetical protein NUW01_03500 [Gemmatimonadaceae bacterium]|nr:hypothetical protein [Gemmatimonadaceae bacterium]